MLGSEVMRVLARDRGIAAIPTTINMMDVTNLAQVRDVLSRHRPTHIIHTAAFTHVDTAEKDPLRAHTINAEGTKNLAFFCREQDIEMIYLSTDYVFSGEGSTPWAEDTPPSPINTYGRTKLLGEQYIATLLDRYKVVRTSWLNGLGGDYTRNFIETMLRISQSRTTLSLVSDQTGRPTFTFDLAPALVALLDVTSYGIYHVCNRGECSWYDFAKEIFAVSGKYNVEVKPITSDHFRSAARRPAYSVLSTARYDALGLGQLPDWPSSLRRYFRRREVFQAAASREEPGPSPHAERMA